MKEIPVSLVRANQFVMVGLTILAIILQSNIILALTLLLVLLPLIFGAKANIVFVLVKSLFPKDRSNEEKEAAELQRFNQTIAASLLAIGFIISVLTGHWIAWLFVGMVTVAATIALLGFCVGCFIYYQWKKQKYKLTR